MGRNRRPERGIGIASRAVREAETDAAPETAAGDGGGRGAAQEPGAQPELPTPPSAGGGARARTAA